MIGGANRPNPWTACRISNIDSSSASRRKEDRMAKIVELLKLLGYANMIVYI